VTGIEQASEEEAGLPVSVSAPNRSFMGSFCVIVLREEAHPGCIQED
jgi:hypothetical protein